MFFQVNPRFLLHRILHPLFLFSREKTASRKARRLHCPLHSKNHPVQPKVLPHRCHTPHTYRNQMYTCQTELAPCLLYPHKPAWSPWQGPFPQCLLAKGSHIPLSSAIRRLPYPSLRTCRECSWTRRSRPFLASTWGWSPHLTRGPSRLTCLSAPGRSARSPSPRYQTNRNPTDPPSSKSLSFSLLTPVSGLVLHRRDFHGYKNVLKLLFKGLNMLMLSPVIDKE